MRRFLITSPKYSGQAELVYNEKETLCMIDCTKTDMDETVIDHFKRAVPVTIHKLQAGASFNADVTVVESDFVVSFKRFYDEYPLKRNRYKAEQVWGKLSKTDQVKAFYSLHHYKKYLSRNQWLTPMIADNYLRNKHYETEWNKV
ncbi:MAG: hypothetical protein ACT4OJ_04905 [Bacteroidota bacterium]